MNTKPTPLLNNQLAEYNQQHKEPKVDHQLFEALEYKDMDGMIKPVIHVDEFASKMGDDDEIIVISFFVRSNQAAKDLVNWFEKGYEWVMDAATSPGEISPGRFLVYVELRRRTSAGRWVSEMLDELNTLTEFNGNDWTMHYEGKEYPFSQETFDQLVPLSPKAYRQKKETDLNEVRAQAGLDTKQIFERDSAIKTIQSAAGVI
jgi:hypothetical protein